VLHNGASPTAAGQGKMVAIAIFSADPAMRRSLGQLLREDSALSIIRVVDDPTAISLLIDQNHVNVVLADVPPLERLADWRIRHNQTAFVIFVDGADEDDSLDALYAGRELSCLARRSPTKSSPR
jgi:DNA-binding NarL/FixJ family response regulator